MMRYTYLTDNSSNFLERKSPKQFTQICEDISLRLRVKDSMFLYHFVDPVLRVEIFKNEGATEKGTLILKEGI